MDRFENFLAQAIKKKKRFWLRQVIVPGINDDEKHVKALKKFADGVPNVEKVELLPYHSMAKEKYKNLGIKYRLEEVEDMNKQKCKELEKLLNN